MKKEIEFGVLGTRYWSLIGLPQWIDWIWDLKRKEKGSYLKICFIYVHHVVFISGKRLNHVSKARFTFIFSINA